MIRKPILIFTLCLFFCGALSAQEDTAKAHWFRDYYKKYVKEALSKQRHNYIPSKGVVPDSTTAIKIAEIILSGVYGKRMVDGEKPFTALLVDGCWVVYGHLPDNFLYGGAAEIIIRKTNGEVVNISHGK